MSQSMIKAPADSLTYYLGQIRKVPGLSAKEEFDLATRWRDHEDQEAADKIVTSYLPYVFKIAKGFMGYGLPMDELVSEGNVGIMEAIKRFEPEVGVRFSTYSRWWIRSKIQEYVLHKSSIVKMGTTASHKKLFFNLRRLKIQIGVISGGDMRPEVVEQISHTLKVPPEDVVIINRRLAGPDSSLNAPIRPDDDREAQDLLTDERESPEEEYNRRDLLSTGASFLQAGLQKLSERERHILIERRLKDEPITLEDLSEQYGISRERIRQIEAVAFKKLEKCMNAMRMQGQDQRRAERIGQIEEAARRKAMQKAQRRAEKIRQTEVAAIQRELLADFLEVLPGFLC